MNPEESLPFSSPLSALNFKSLRICFLFLSAVRFLWSPWRRRAPLRSVGGSLRRRQRTILTSPKTTEVRQADVGWWLQPGRDFPTRNAEMDHSFLQGEQVSMSSFGISQTDTWAGACHLPTGHPKTFPSKAEDPWEPVLAVLRDLLNKTQAPVSTPPCTHAPVSTTPI